MRGQSTDCTKIHGLRKENYCKCDGKCIVSPVWFHLGGDNAQKSLVCGWTTCILLKSWDALSILALERFPPVSRMLLFCLTEPQTPVFLCSTSARLAVVNEGG